MGEGWCRVAPDRTLADDGKRFTSDGRFISGARAFIYKKGRGFGGRVVAGRRRTGPGRMTGSALQAMDVLFSCASLSLEKGKGVWGKGGGRSAPEGTLADFFSSFFGVFFEVPFLRGVRTPFFGFRPAFGVPGVLLFGAFLKRARLFPKRWDPRF